MELTPSELHILDGACNAAGQPLRPFTALVEDVEKS
jgi:hypothetical protein